jgi:tetratricopeptide (TPR) repeat protein
VPPPQLRVTPPPAPPPGDDGLDLSDELGEVDFLVQEGVLDEAGETLRNLLSFYPDHPGLRSRLAEVERRAAAAAPALGAASPATPPALAPAPSAALADGAFDIGRELAAELGTEMPPPAEELQYSVEEVFSQFKKGVAQTVKAEDTDTHYDLGIAYKEMGLVDDALQEFETALQGATRRRVIDCLSMVALCHMEKGDAAGAVQAWRRALRSDWLTPETARAVHYELALAHKGAADVEAALWYLNKVVKADPGFRDAAALLASLGGGPGRPPPDAEGGPPPPAPTSTDPRGGGAGGPKRNIGYL